MPIRTADTPEGQTLRSLRTIKINSYVSRKIIADISRTVLRRSELKSRTVLMDEQSNPWELVHPQDTVIQHRGGKLLRRYGLLEEITLLSLS